MITGLLFGIAPIICISFNGYMLGSIYSLASLQIGHMNSALAIFTHGLFEIPAIIISCSYGFWLGVMFYNKTVNGQTIDLKIKLRHALKINIIVVIPLLIIAAFIETYITPHVYSRVP